MLQALLDRLSGEVSGYLPATRTPEGLPVGPAAPDSALRKIDEALKDHPDDVALLTRKRDLLYDRRRLDAAAQVAEKLMAADVGHREDHRRYVLRTSLEAAKPFSLVRLYDGDLECAARDLEALVPKVLEAPGPDEERVTLKLSLAEHFLYLNRLESAWPLLYGLQQQGGHNKSNLMLYNFVKRAAARPDEDLEPALRKLVESASTPLERNALCLWFARYLAEVSQPDRALPLWETVMAGGRYDQRHEAFRDFERTSAENIAQEGGVADSLYARLMAAASNEEDREFWRLRFGQHFLRHAWPERGEVLVRMALEAADPDQRREARSALQELAQSYQGKAQAYFRRGARDPAAKEWNEIAIAAQRKAIALSGAPSPDWVARLAWMYLESGQPDAAAAQYEKALNMAPPGQQRPEYALALARSLAAAGQDSLAEWHFVRAVARAADAGQSTDALDRYGDFLVERGRIQGVPSGSMMTAQVEPLLPIERLAQDLAQVRPEQGYAEPVERMACLARRFLAAGDQGEQVDALLLLAGVCAEVRDLFKAQAALSRAYELSETPAQKDRTLTRALRLLGCRQYEVLSQEIPEAHLRSFVTGWSVIGPFERPHPTADLLTATRLDFDRTYPGRDGPVRWAQPPSPESLTVPTARLFRPPADVVVCAVSFVHSPKAQRAQARVCGEACLTVWLNDAEVLAPPAADRDCVELGERVADVALRKGWNKILLRQSGTVRSRLLHFRLCDEEGGALDGIEVSAVPE